MAKLAEGAIVRIDRGREARDQKVAGMLGTVAKDYGSTVSVNVRGRKEPVHLPKKTVREAR